MTNTNLCNFLSTNSKYCLCTACCMNTTSLHLLTELDQCTPNPCLNEAICLNQVDGYHCLCAPNWDGVHCEAGELLCFDF